MLHDIRQAETREDAHKAFDLFVETFKAKYPGAAECLIKDREELMTFFDFPAQHRQSIRTSNPIESAFATIRHRTTRTTGCLSRDGMLHMMFRLGQCAGITGIARDKPPGGLVHARFIIYPLVVLSPGLCRTNGQDPFPVVGNDPVRRCMAFLLS